MTSKDAWPNLRGTQSLHSSSSTSSFQPSGWAATGREACPWHIDRSDPSLYKANIFHMKPAPPTGWRILTPGFSWTLALRQTDVSSTQDGGYGRHWRRGEAEKKTYNTKDSPVVTDLSTSLALIRLTRGERTGSRTFVWIWSYVVVRCCCGAEIGGGACWSKSRKKHTTVYDTGDSLVVTSLCT